MRILTRPGATITLAVGVVFLMGARTAHGQTRSSDGAEAPRASRSTETSGSFFRDVGSDFAVYVTSPQTYTTLATGFGAGLALSPLDDRIAASRFNGERHPSSSVDRTFEAGEVLGGTLVQVGGAAVTYTVGRIIGQPGVSALGRDLIRVQILNAAVTQGLKYTVGRERPDGSSRRSFPSGHASGTFATATVLHRHYGWRVGGPAFAVASYVAASRLSENKHYLSDVVFGAAIGMTAGRAVTITRGDTELRLAPGAVPGGAALQVSVTGW